MITPYANLLAADTIANQGSERKELASMEATGATTHVRMWLDPSTKKPCGHSLCLKPKVTRKTASARKSDGSFSVFSPHCDSVQGSNVTAHILSKHQVPTAAKLLALTRQEGHFAH
jgi:hypothetical protein